MSEHRTLFIHAGAHKTGSSALQLYFERNKARLEEAGISYENAPAHLGDHYGVGNGQGLCASIGSTSAAQLSDVVETYFRGRTKALCSSEDFCATSKEGWRVLVSACEQIGVRMQIIMFVRDPGAFMMSHYKQWIKGGTEHRSFREFLDDASRPAYADSLRSIYEVLGTESFRVLHYETEKKRLDAAFMPLIGVDPAALDRSYLERDVNRSLTDFELTLARKANEIYSRLNWAQFASVLGYSMTEALLRKHPNLQGRHSLSDEDQALIAERFREDVHWVNGVFFGGKDVVSLRPGSLAAKGATPELTDAQKLVILEDAFLWAITKIKDFYTYDCHRSQLMIERALDVARGSNVSAEGLPDGFDPLSYLIMNPDVLKAGINPCQHYIETGQKEGRKHNWRVA